MGISVRARVDKNKDVQTVIEQLRSTLASMGYDNIQFNVKQSSEDAKFSKHRIEATQANVNLFLGNG